MYASKLYTETPLLIPPTISESVRAATYLASNEEVLPVHVASNVVDVTTLA